MIKWNQFHFQKKTKVKLEEPGYRCRISKFVIVLLLAVVFLGTMPVNAQDVEGDDDKKKDFQLSYNLRVKGVSEYILFHGVELKYKHHGLEVGPFTESLSVLWESDPNQRVVGLTIYYSYYLDRKKEDKLFTYSARAGYLNYRSASGLAGHYRYNTSLDAVPPGYIMHRYKLNAFFLAVEANLNIYQEVVYVNFAVETVLGFSQSKDVQDNTVKKHDPNFLGLINVGLKVNFLNF